MKPGLFVIALIGAGLAFGAFGLVLFILGGF